jgi:Flp pilus assembly protein TadD
MSTTGSGVRRTVFSARRGARVAALLIALTILSGVVLWIRAEWAVWSEARAARRAFAAGRLAEAEARIDRWLTARPGSGEAHFLKAWFAFCSERPQVAIDELARARSLGYPAPSLDRLDAIVRARARRYTEAEPVLRRILAQSVSPDPEVEEALAQVYLETYHFQAAAAVLDRWMRGAPLDPKPYLWRIEIDERLNPDPALKIANYRAALERDPYLDKARLGLADELRKLHRHAEAALEYATYLAHRPDDPAGLLGAGLTALESGDEAAAQGYLDRALKLAPNDPDAQDGRARLALRRGEASTALAGFDRALALQPHDVQFHYHRALCLARLGRRDEARAEQATAERLRRDEAELVKIQQALVRDPNNIAMQTTVARWLYEHGHQDEGLRWARKIVSERPADPEANRLLADYHQRRGEAGLAKYYQIQADGAR